MSTIIAPILVNLVQLINPLELNKGEMSSVNVKSCKYRPRYGMNGCFGNSFLALMSRSLYFIEFESKYDLKFLKD